MKRCLLISGPAQIMLVEIEELPIQMRRQKLISLEQEREICRKYHSGEKQNALASEYGVNQSVISRLIKNLSAVDPQFNRPSDTASSFQAD